LLGYVQVPNEQAAPGKQVTFLLQTPFECFKNISDKPETVTLDVAWLHLSVHSGRKLAVKSNDVPLETLKKIPTWENV
jgi:hypothetical protein